MRIDRLSRSCVALAGALLAACPAVAGASEPLPQYYHVLQSLPQRVRDAERSITRDVFIATKLTSKPGPAVQVDRIALLGVTALPAAELQAIADAKAGATLSPEQIDAVAEDIAKHYRAKGFPLAMAALVDVQGGTARIQVYEGKLANVRVEGAKAYAEEAVMQPYLALPRGKPLTAVELESASRNLDDFAGLSVQVQALPAKTAGETDLIVKVSEQRITGGVGMDNDGIESIGRQRYRAEMQWNSPSGWGDQLGISLLNSDMGGLKYLRLDYSLPFDSNTHAELSYALSEYESSNLGDAVLGPYSAFGDTSDIRISIVDVLQRGRGATQVMDYYFQRVEGTVYTTGAPIVLTPPYDSSGLFVFGVGWFSSSQASDGTGSSARVSFETNGKHNDGTESDALLGQLRFDVQNLAGDRARIFTRLRGAYSVSAAPLLKRYIVGGPDSVRAYDYAMREGDHGADATAEFRFGSTGASGLRREFVLFADAAYVGYQTGTSTPTGSDDTLFGGAGAGLRFHTPGFEFTVEYAYPVGQHATPDADKNGYFWGRLSVGLD
jgi:hemolysin activation/secretion protein